MFLDGIHKKIGKIDYGFNIVTVVGSLPALSIIFQRIKINFLFSQGFYKDIGNAGTAGKLDVCVRYKNKINHILNSHLVFALIQIIEAVFFFYIGFNIFFTLCFAFGTFQAAYALFMQYKNKVNFEEDFVTKTLKISFREYIFTNKNT